LRIMSLIDIYLYCHIRILTSVFGIALIYKSM
jgi:hypothetical protein